MEHTHTQASSRMLILATAAVAVLAGCGSDLDGTAPEQAYWQADAPPPVVQMGRAPAGRLGLRRRTGRLKLRRKTGRSDPLPPETLSKSEDLHPDARDEPVAMMVSKLSGTSPFEEDNVNLDVRPTLADAFAQRVVERGVWFGVGQMLGGGPVSVAIFAARHWE